MPNTVAASIAIRELRSDELIDATNLRLEMIRELDGENLDAKNPGWRERFVAFFAKLLADGRGAIFGIGEKSQLIGMAAVYMLANPRSEIYRQRSAYITHVYVVPSQRRKGIARRLTRGAIEWARQHDCQVVRLRTSKMGKSVYTALGFKQSDELELTCGARPD